MSSQIFPSHRFLHVAIVINDLKNHTFSYYLIGISFKLIKFSHFPIFLFFFRYLIISNHCNTIDKYSTQTVQSSIFSFHSIPEPISGVFSELLLFSKYFSCSLFQNFKFNGFTKKNSQLSFITPL